jgi:ABC-type multidrug transport system ATPase subunit
MNPTFGEAFIFGHSINEDSALVQSIMGICPQENLLWDNLTSYEHLLLYASLRGNLGSAVVSCMTILALLCAGLSQQDLPRAIQNKLNEFHLGDLIHSPTKNVSLAACIMHRARGVFVSSILTAPPCSCPEA